MQQVFSMCSMLLQRNTNTRKRKLNIRRYKVTRIINSLLSKIINQHWDRRLHLSFHILYSSFIFLVFLYKIFIISQNIYSCITWAPLTPTSSQVVPFSQRSGVLEWCSGTMPIGEFLVDPAKGAHKRFRPQDWSNLASRNKMTVQLRHSDAEWQTQLRTFLWL